MRQKSFAFIITIILYTCSALNLKNEIQEDDNLSVYVFSVKPFTHVSITIYYLTKVTIKQFFKSILFTQFDIALVNKLVPCAWILSFALEVWRL